jgi:hypothetical protein
MVAACALSAGPAAAGSLHGMVRDAATLVPVGEAYVTLHVINPDSLALPTQSDLSGAYAIPDVPGGNEIYVLVCSRWGYSGFYARVQDPGTSDLAYDILLEPLPPPPPPPDDPPDSSWVSGVVTTIEGGSLAPVAGATVTFRSGEWTYVALTDAAGHYATVVNPGVYSASVQAAGFETLHQSGLPAEPAGLVYNAVLEAAVLDVPPDGTPDGSALRGIFPSPFRQSATIQYQLARSGHVRLRVHDLMGRTVRTLFSGWQPAGAHAVTLRAEGLAAGTYYCVLQSGGSSARKPVTLLR